MTMSNKERQAAFREQMSKKGLVQVPVYIPEAYRSRLIAWAKKIRREHNDTIV